MLLRRRDFMFLFCGMLASGLGQSIVGRMGAYGYRNQPPDGNGVAADVIEALIREEFRQGKIRVVDGLVLSETEAQFAQTVCPALL